MSKDNKTPTPLSVMLGDGGSFDVQGKTYAVKPLALKQVKEFMKDNLSLGPQFFNMTDEKSRKKVDKWLSRYCFDEEGNSVTLEKAEAEDWDVVDLKEFFKRLCDFSG